MLSLAAAGAGTLAELPFIVKCIVSLAAAAIEGDRYRAKSTVDRTRAQARPEPVFHAIHSHGSA